MPYLADWPPRIVWVREVYVFTISLHSGSCNNNPTTTAPRCQSTIFHTYFWLGFLGACRSCKINKYILLSFHQSASTQEPEPEVCVKNGTPASWGGTCRVIVTRIRVQRYCENIYFLQEKPFHQMGTSQRAYTLTCENIHMWQPSLPG